jgi:hypothetical protein
MFRARLTAGPLTLNQMNGVRIPGSEPKIYEIIQTERPQLIEMAGLL